MQNYANYYDTGETASWDTIGIGCAKIANVPENTAEQRMITIAPGVQDGGGASTDYFTRYFDRFAIDPPEYAESPSYHPQKRLINTAPPEMGPEVL